jgi:hypothetical protein
MVSYASLKPVEQKALLAKFRLVLKTNGFEEVKDSDVQELFDALAGDLEFEVLAVQEYEATYEEMIDMAGQNLSDEEWKERRQKALKKNAKGEIQEYMKQQDQPTYAYVPNDVGPIRPSYETVNDVAHASGVNLHPVEGKGSDVYYVDFPTIKDKEFMPMLKIVYPAGSKNVKDAVFVIETPYADKDSAKASPIDRQPTQQFKADSVPRAVNTLILDYLLNRGVRTVVPGKGEVGVNDIIDDHTMVHFAERLFGFQLNEKPILDPQINLYKAFLRVLLRDDQSSSLQDRVKKVRTIIDSDDMVVYFRESLMARGSSALTLDAVIEDAKMRREGKLKEKK